MPFIRAQKIVRDETGAIKSGSASVVDVEYVPGGKYHSRQRVRERLGKVVELAEDGRSGVFLSPTRGLVRYDADADRFDAVEKGDGTLSDESRAFPEPGAHVIAGDALLLLSILKSSGALGVLRSAFPKDAELERLLAHLLHSILRDGSRIACDDLVARSAASHLFSGVSVPSLRSDSAYFCAMGADEAKVAFFRALVAHMRDRDASFGTCCYVDSTPLPNDVADNPLDALSSHGLGEASLQSRLALVLDNVSGIPVWYQVIPGNVIGVSTLASIRQDVEATLGVTVSEAVLDAGYVTQDLIAGDMRYLARMPARRGYPFRTLWHEARGQTDRGKYAFVRAGHTYFGRHFTREVQGKDCHLYVFVDKDNALSCLRKTMSERPEEYDAMLERDKDWEQVRGGYFVLVSNMEEMSPARALDAYFGRMEIEEVFKTAKDHLRLLPLSKWSERAMRGKVLHDVICTAALLDVRKAIAKADKGWSPTDLWGKTSSLMCFRNGPSLVLETPNKQCRQRFEALGFSVPAKVDVAAYRRDVLGLKG